MNCKGFLTSLAIACSIIMTGTMTASANEGLGIGAKAGTLGLGVEVSTELLPNTRLRGGFNYLTYSFDSNISNINYDFEPEFNSFSLLLDLHPFGGAFFLSGGVYFNNNSVGVTGSIPPEDIPAAYSAYTDLINQVSISGDVEFNPVAPYAGLGWRSNSGDPGWGFALELGVLFQGAPDVTNLRVNGPIDLNSNSSVQNFLADQEKEIEDELDWFQFYPVASAIVTYHF